MNNSDPTYTAVAKAVREHWRRRLLAIAHILTFFFLYQAIWVRTTWYYESIQTVWFGLVVFHLMWALVAELRDRAIRREIERERKWRLLERLEDADPYVRERLVRLADAPDGELIDFDAAAWADDIKQKRG